MSIFTSLEKMFTEATLTAKSKAKLVVAKAATVERKLISKSLEHDEAGVIAVAVGSTALCIGAGTLVTAIVGLPILVGVAAGTVGGCCYGLRYNRVAKEIFSKRIADNGPAIVASVNETLHGLANAVELRAAAKAAK